MHRSQQIEFHDYISPDGRTYRFDNRNDRFVYAFEGDGMPDIDYITQQGPGQHGETVIDYQLKPRTIQLLHRRNGCGRSNYWDNRADMLNLLRPNRQSYGSVNPGRLRRRLPGGTVRDIDVFIMPTTPKFSARPEDSYDEFGISEVIRFYAPDPTYYDPTQVCLEWTLASQDHLIFPITFPIMFGTSVIDADLVVTYAGTWLAYPTIEITGPISGLEIINETLGKTLALNYVISAGETVTINLAYGNKSVTSDIAGNLIGALKDDGEDLVGFYLAPDPEASGGVNALNVVGASAIVGTTSVEIAYYTRYIGI